MGALVQLLPRHHRLRPAKGGSAPSSPCPWLPDRRSFRRITSLCLRSGPQSGSPLDQAHPLRGGRDFYARACPTAGHPTAKSGITTQLSGPLLRRDLHPLGECCYGLQLRSRDITPLRRYRGPLRHPLAFRPFPSCRGYRAYLAPPLSRRGEEGFSSCSTRPGHRAAANHPARVVAASVSHSAAHHAAFALRKRARPLELSPYEATSRSPSFRPDDSLPIL